MSGSGEAQSEIGVSQAQVPPARSDQVSRASARGGKIHPQAWPLDLCVQPVSRINEPSYEPLEIKRGNQRRWVQ